MIDTPKIVEGNGVTIFKNSDSKVLDAMNNIKPSGTVKYSIRQNKIVSQNLIPGINYEDAKKSLFNKDGIFEYIGEETSKQLSSLIKEGIVEKDTTILKPFEYVTICPYTDKMNMIHLIGVSLNSGYKLSMTWLAKMCGSFNVDVIEDVKKLFGLAKSYWNLKKDGAVGDKVAIDKLESDIKDLSKKIDVARIKIWTTLRDKCGVGAMLWDMGKINPIDPKWRDIIFYKDPWLVFAAYIEIMTSTSPSTNKDEYYDKLISFELGSLNSDELKTIYGGSEGSEYPLDIQIMFNVNSKFLGGYKFTRPDGRSF